MVIAVIAGVAYDAGGASDTHAAISLAYTAAIGVLSAAALWFVTSSVNEDIDATDLNPGNGRALAGWTVLTSSLLVPVALLVLAFPDFLNAG